MSVTIELASLRKRFALALMLAAALTGGLLIQSVVLHAAGEFHPLVCHNLDQYNDWFWWFWYECYLPHGPECAIGG